MAEPRDPVRLSAAERCKHPGCTRRRLGPSDRCAEHLNEKLAAEREARERARVSGAGNWAGWDLPPASKGGLLGRLLDAAASAGGRPSEGKDAAGSGGAAPKESLEEIRAEVAAELEREAEKLGIAGLFPGGSARSLVERIERSAAWLTPEQQVEAWRAVRGLVERGVTDVERWRSALAALAAPPARGDPAPGPAQGERGDEGVSRGGAGEDRAAIEREIGRAASRGVAAAADHVFTQLREGARVAAKTIERASREGGPLDAKTLAAIAGAIEREIGELGRSARSGALRAAARAILPRETELADRLGGAIGALADRLASGLAIARRRLEGRYETDPYGRDEDVVRLARPILRFLYRTWFRVEASGLEHVPARGPALIVANHGAVLPLDAAMIATAIEEEGPRRAVRVLVFEWLARLPFAAELLQKTGMVVAHPENAERLLSEGHLVLAFPEGPDGGGKRWRERYELEPFGPELVRAALAARAPIIPCAVLGSEESWPRLGNAGAAARLLRLPYLPLTPTFPWLGPLGLVPLPARWRIRFGAPIVLDPSGPEQAGDDALVSRWTSQAQRAVKDLLDGLLRERGAIFA